jgi:hypothetical protein
VADTSCLTTDNGIYTVAIVKTMFSCQLVFRRNITGAFDGPMVLHEAQNIENCLLFYVKGALYITFLTSGSLFMCASEDKGASFSRPARYRNRFCQGPEKAFFISQPDQSEDGLYLRQVYVDRHSPWDIQVVPELYDEFYNAGPKPEGNSFDEVERLENEIKQLRRENEEKDDRIAALNRMLNNKRPETMF